MFKDFSSAFSTLRLHVLMERLLQSEMKSRIIRWVESFLTDISQCESKCCSVLPYYHEHWGPTRELYLSSPVSSDVFNLKSADDTVIVGSIAGDETNYRGCADEFAQRSR